jgi:hypothetical protein
MPDISIKKLESPTVPSLTGIWGEGRGQSSANRVSLSPLPVYPSPSQSHIYGGGISVHVLVQHKKGCGNKCLRRKNDTFVSPDQSRVLGGAERVVGCLCWELLPPPTSLWPRTYFPRPYCVLRPQSNGR